MSEANEPAFPTSRYLPKPDGMYLDIGHYEPVPAGITKRELFAAMAMQGILASDRFDWHLNDAVAEAVHAADALLTELAKPKETP